MFSIKTSTKKSIRFVHFISLPTSWISKKHTWSLANIWEKRSFWNSKSIESIASKWFSDSSHSNTCRSNWCKYNPALHKMWIMAMMIYEMRCTNLIDFLVLVLIENIIFFTYHSDSLTSALTTELGIWLRCTQRFSCDLFFFLLNVLILNRTECPNTQENSWWSSWDPRDTLL